MYCIHWVSVREHCCRSAQVRGKRLKEKKYRNRLAENNKKIMWKVALKIGRTLLSTDRHDIVQWKVKLDVFMCFVAHDQQPSISLNNLGAWASD